MNGHASLLLLVTTLACDVHTITVVVPVKDVPARTLVDAAIVPGHVVKFESSTRLYADGVVARDHSVLARLAPDDLVVLRAGDGETFGDVRVACSSDDHKAFGKCSLREQPASAAGHERKRVRTPRRDTLHGGT